MSDWNMQLGPHELTTQEDWEAFMDAELQKDIRIIKDIRESFTNAAKVSAMHQARCESLDRTIARLEALAVGPELPVQLRECEREREYLTSENARLRSERDAAQHREAKLRQLCEANVWLYQYQVLKILDGNGGE